MADTDSTPFFSDSPDLGADGTLDAALDTALAAPEPEADDDADTDEYEGEASPDESLDDGSSPEPDERESTRKLKAELDALRAERAEIESFKQAQAQAQAEHYWNSQWQGIQSGYAQAEQRIYAEAQKAYDPAAYVRERMAQLNQWRDGATATYYQQREQSLWQFAARQAVPGYAQEVARHYRLNKDDAKRLLKFPPEMMPQIAEELKAIRQNRKSAVAMKQAANPAPGSGTARTGSRRPESLDDLIDGLFAGR